MGDRHLSSWPPSVPRELTLPKASVWSNLEASAAKYPDRACIVFYDSVLTYAQVKEQAEQLAGFLQQECGVKRGDRVAVYMQNSPQWVIGFYAVLRADAAVVPVNPMNRTLELGHMLSDSGSHVVLTSQELVSQILPLGAQGPKHVVVATYSDYLTKQTDLNVPDFLRAPRELFDAPGVTAWSAALSRKLTPAPHTATPEDLAVIPYTSGTTGNPKGCMHTHASVMHNAMAVSKWYGVADEESVLTVLPLFHVTGMQSSMNSTIFTGGTIVLLPRWDRTVAAELIQRYKVTGWTAVPTMVVDMLSAPDIGRFDLSSIRFMGGGGAAMPEAIAQKLKDLTGLTYLEGYGLSETIAPTHMNPAHNAKKQCLGIPIFGTESRVVDPETFRELGVGEVGEIITRGPQVFKGYWNNPEATAEAFVEIDGKQFFRTGDLGKIDEEGYFFLVDRLKRMINAAGYKVWPAEVELMLYAHPAVKESVVIGSKDPRKGETVKAVLVLKPDAKLDEAEFTAWCQQRMAAYKVPRTIEIVDVLPKGATGKIMWRELQEKENAKTAAPSEPQPRA